MFIAFEGADGAGKSTQLQLLAADLRAAGRTVTTTREPGGSPTFGGPLRQLLLHTKIDMGARAEALLFAADRAEHVRTVIRPALGRGEVVLCDRFVDSTLAYQGAGRGLDADDLLSLSRFATDGLFPDLVVVCDLSADAAALRQHGRGPADRMEAAGLGSAVRSLLLARAQANREQYVVVDADGSVEQVSARVRRAVQERRPSLFAR